MPFHHDPRRTGHDLNEQIPTGINQQTESTEENAEQPNHFPADFHHGEEKDKVRGKNPGNPQKREDGEKNHQIHFIRLGCTIRTVGSPVTTYTIQGKRPADQQQPNHLSAERRIFAESLRNQRRGNQKGPQFAHVTTLEQVVFPPVNAAPQRGQNFSAFQFQTDGA